MKDVPAPNFVRATYRWPKARNRSRIERRRQMRHKRIVAELRRQAMTR